MSKRVVITGIGVVSPVGNNLSVTWSSLCSGKSGIDRVTLFDATDYPSQVAAEVKNLDFNQYVEAKEVRRTDRTILLSIVAAKMAMADAKVDMAKEDPLRCGTIVGTGIGGITTLENEVRKLVERGPSRVSPFLIPMMITDMPAGRISMEFGLKGPNFAVVSACASSAHSIGEAFLHIKSGIADIMVTGGTEAAIGPIAYAGFSNMRALSTRNENPQKASSPFDKKRDGFVIGEGSTVVVLESLEHARARKATIHAELLGYGATGDAYHLSAPDPEGAGGRAAMQIALRSAGLEPSSIDYINAHGTSTELNDKIETAAIKKVFGEYAKTVAISSTKSMTGHLLGSAGALELAVSVMAIRDGIIPPTINYEDPDPECDLNYTPNTAVKKTVRYALSNSFGFGGHNACLILGRYENPPVPT
ncbi:MAG: beta-ketoacyl-ACP synthase II [Chitinispirillaceae bacterium]|nr:beta-ketoacyl-ACP synthase II [Chitinispirillaceae bacterium]